MDEYMDFTIFVKINGRIVLSVYTILFCLPSHIIMSLFFLLY